MTRRIYKNQKARRKKLKERALEYFRAARQTVDPLLLERTRLLIARTASSSLHEQEAGKDSEAGAGDASASPVDRQKTITTIMKFMELKKDDKAFHDRVKKFLGQNGGTGEF